MYPQTNSSEIGRCCLTPITADPLASCSQDTTFHRVSAQKHISVLRIRFYYFRIKIVQIPVSKLKCEFLADILPLMEKMCKNLKYT